MSRNVDEWLLQVKGLDAYQKSGKRVEYSRDLICDGKLGSSSFSNSVGNPSEATLLIIEQLHPFIRPHNFLLVTGDQLQLTVTLQHRDIRFTLDCISGTCHTDPFIGSVGDLESFMELLKNSKS